MEQFNVPHSYRIPSEFLGKLDKGGLDTLLKAWQLQAQVHLHTHTHTEGNMAVANSNQI